MNLGGRVSTRNLPLHKWTTCKAGGGGYFGDISGVDVIFSNVRAFPLLEVSGPPLHVMV